MALNQHHHRLKPQPLINTKKRIKLNENEEKKIKFNKLRVFFIQFWRYIATWLSEWVSGWVCACVWQINFLEPQPKSDIVNAKQIIYWILIIFFSISISVAALFTARTHTQASPVHRCRTVRWLAFAIHLKCEEAIRNTYTQLTPLPLQSAANGKLSN